MLIEVLQADISVLVDAECIVNIALDPQSSFLFDLIRRS